MTSSTRTIVVDPDTCPMQESTDAVEGTPKMVNKKGLPASGVALALSFSDIKNVVADEDGAVKKNENAVPPPRVVSVGDPLPPVVYVGLEKSLATPIDGPVASSTVTVQQMTSLTRTKLVEALI